MRKFLMLVCLLILAVFSMDAHSGKAKFHVIIDTDGGTDDMRAICLMLASRDFEVLAFSTSDGVLSPQQTAEKLSALLVEFAHEGIPIGVGKNTLDKAPFFRETAFQLSWGNQQPAKTYPQADELLASAFEQEEEKIVFLCMGGMTNLYRLLEENPSYVNKLDKVLCYLGQKNLKKSFNYRVDPLAFEKLPLKKEQLYIMQNTTNEAFSVSDFSKHRPEGKYAEAVFRNLRFLELNNHLNNDAFIVWDELLPLFLMDSSLFSCVDANNSCYEIRDMQAAMELYHKLLADKQTNRNKVFSLFPVNSDLFQDDVGAVSEEIINRHGVEEWKACVLTNEIHGHLGIYASIGAKMGIRAREYFAVGVDDIHVLTFAGMNPPVSCMNDGLQVSTGGTLGHGLIEVEKAEQPKAEAIFQFKGKQIRMRLKEEYRMQIKTEIQSLVKTYGLSSDTYWEEVRKLAIQYWLEWSRYEIFDIEELE
jgi:inosine-uridine nucleoside N-ribohydrolase/formylmethanofuran dehydrogenase subunit E